MASHFFSSAKAKIRRNTLCIARIFNKVNSTMGGREGALGYKVNSAASGREGALGYKVNSAASGREGPLGDKVNSTTGGREGPLGGAGWRKISVIRVCSEILSRLLILQYIYTIPACLKNRLMKLTNSQKSC